MDKTKFLVTGGAGFIGTAVVGSILSGPGRRVCVFDKLTYAGSRESLSPWRSNPRLMFSQGDICDRGCAEALLAEVQPDCILHLAAETHVDRSIDAPEIFVKTNLNGTFVLLEAARSYWRGLPAPRRETFRFIHVSTDEVFGSREESSGFTELTRYAPNSPYAATKAGADHLARAWHNTFGLPVIITNCSNNYGPRQFPEKLIPLMIINALEGKQMPVYGRGENVRDWLYVDDHADALLLVAARGLPGETYNIGGRNERRNIDIVHAICDILDKTLPRQGSHRDLVTFVADRPGHDLRYTIDCTKIEQELGWRPRESFESGLEKSVRWYLDNERWWKTIRSDLYRGERLGLPACNC
jgi:dTDP-glucose 4,6-dehydratase